jgi:hypothetical protein
MAVSGAQHTYQTAELNAVPDEPGTYELISGQDTIFLGWTEMPGLKTKIREHYSGKHGSCTQIATRFKFEVHDDPEKRCEELLASYKKEFGSVPRCNL